MKMFELNALKGKFLSVSKLQVLLEANDLSLQALGSGAAQAAEELQENLNLLEEERVEVQARLTGIVVEMDEKAGKVRQIQSALRSLNLG